MGWQTDENTTVEYFDGLGAFLARLDTLKPLGQPQRDELQPRGWNGNVTFDVARRMAVDGDAELTDRVEKVVNSIDADQYLTDAPRLFRPSVVGPLVCVPAYLAGLPDCMRVQSGIMASTQGLVTICVNAVCSSGVPADKITEIGSAVCALALTLQRVRPVEIVITGNLGDGKRGQWAGVPVIRYGVSPFDASTLAFSLAHPAFLRMLLFRWNYGQFRHDGSFIPWGWSLYEGRGEAEARLRELCGAEAEWLYVGGARLMDQEVFKDPTKWVRDQIERLTKQSEAY